MSSLIIYNNTELNPTSAWVVMGIQYGDEGKGKVVDEVINELSLTHDVIYCVRFNGGSNAGHSIWIYNVLYDTHICPSGIVNKTCINIIGCGTVINPIQMFGEIEKLEAKNIDTKDRILISQSAHVTLLIHKLVDKVEGRKFGSTGNGISQTVGDKANRRGMSMFEFKLDNWENKIIEIYEYYKKHFSDYVEFIHEFQISRDNPTKFNSFDEMCEYEINYIKSKHDILTKMITNTKNLLNKLDKNVPVIFEGANSIMLDSNVGYPNCSATTCTIGAVFSGSGITPEFLRLKNAIIIGVTKGYITRVGDGTLITQDDGEDGAILQSKGNEFGTTTGRKRRTGWIDIPQLIFANMITGCNYLNITKLDILSNFDKIKVCVAYKHKHSGEIYHERIFDDLESNNFEPVYEELDGWKDFDISQCKNYDDLHPNIKGYIDYIENHVNVPVKFINIGREQGQIIVKN